MQKEIYFYQEMASEHRLQEYSKGPVPLYLVSELDLNGEIRIYCYKIVYYSIIFTLSTLEFWLQISKSGDVALLISRIILMLVS